MAFKTTLLVYVLALFAQNAYSQVQGFGNSYGSSYGSLGFGEVEVAAVEVGSVGIGSGFGGYGFGNGAAGFGGTGATGLGAAGVTSSPAFLNLNGLAAGGVLPISSVGPIIPAGLSVVSDNVIEGAVVINGQLPFLSAVAFEGSLPSAGSGVSQCGCGNGNIGILSESVAPVTGISGMSGLGLGGLGLSGLSGRGLVL